MKIIDRIVGAFYEWRCRRLLRKNPNLARALEHWRRS